MADRSFVSIQREWYQKLKAEGFEDIEQVGHDGAPLPMLVTDIRIDPDRHPHVVEPTQEYFSRCAEFLHRGGLAGLERNVWAAHVDGASMRDIARTEGVSLKKVFTTLHQLEDRLTAWWGETAAKREQESRRPRGRPAKEDRSEVRGSLIGAHVTAEELAVLAEAAKLAGARSVSSWLRDIAIETAKKIASENMALRINQSPKRAA